MTPHTFELYCKYNNSPHYKHKIIIIKFNIQWGQLDYALFDGGGE